MKTLSLFFILSLLCSMAYAHIATDTTAVDSVVVPKEPSWEKLISVGTSLSHTLNVNPPNNAPKQGFAFVSSLDASINFIKESSRFKMANQLIWTFSFNKANAKSITLNTTDQLQTLHDWSYAIKKRGSWNTNVIIKTETQAFTQYDGSYLKDYNQLGQIQRFLNPYKYTISPGIQYNTGKGIKISLSPYSVEFFGLTDQFIADKGQFITEQNLDGHYKLKVKNNLGAETNIWFDKKIKKRLIIKYRVNVSSNYFENILKNGRLGGNFITTLNLFKGLGLTHRAVLKGDLAQKPFKPYYTQVVLLSYTKSL